MSETVNAIMVELKVMVKVSDSTSDQSIGGLQAIEVAKELMNNLTYHNGLLITAPGGDRRLLAEVDEVTQVLATGMGKSAPDPAPLP